MTYLRRPNAFNRLYAYTAFAVAGTLIFWNIGITQRFIWNQFQLPNNDARFLGSWIIAITICVYEGVYLAPVLNPLCWPWLLDTPDRIKKSFEPRYQPYYLIATVFIVLIATVLAIGAFWLDTEATINEMPIKWLFLRRVLAVILVFVPEFLIALAAFSLGIGAINTMKVLPAETQVRWHAEEARNIAEDVKDAEHSGRQARNVRANRRL